MVGGFGDMGRKDKTKKAVCKWDKSVEMQMVEFNVAMRCNRSTYELIEGGVISVKLITTYR